MAPQDTNLAPNLPESRAGSAAGSGLTALIAQPGPSASAAPNPGPVRDPFDGKSGLSVLATACLQHPYQPARNGIPQFQRTCRDTLTALAELPSQVYSWVPHRDSRFKAAEAIQPVSHESQTVRSWGTPVNLQSLGTTQATPVSRNHAQAQSITINTSATEPTTRVWDGMLQSILLLSSVIRPSS